MKSLETSSQEKNKSSLELINSRITEAAVANDYEMVAELAKEAMRMLDEGEKMTENHLGLEDNVLSSEIYKRQEEELRARAEVQRNDDLERAENLLKQIQDVHGVASTQEKMSKPESDEFVDLYGMSEEALQKTLNERGYIFGGEGVDSHDPEFDEKMEMADEAHKKYGQARVKLFDRVLSGKATENEIKIAENHAKFISGIFGLRGFHSSVPKSWYSNEGLSEAMASVSDENRQIVKDVRAHYSTEQLQNGGFEKIDENGNRSTYVKEGF